MQPTLCSRCKKHVAVVVISKMEGDKPTNEGLCLKCAKELGLPQVDDMMKRMGISDEDLDTLNNEMLQAMSGVENIEDLPGGEDGLAIESKTLPLGAYGGDMDFYAMKGAIEAILQELRVKDVTFRIGRGLPEELSYHPGRFAAGWSGSDCLGWVGQIHPLVAKNYGVDAEFYCAELAMDELENAKGADPEYVPLPKFPAVTRDIAVVCDRAVTVGALEDCIRRGAKGLLKDVSLIDIYTGSGIPEGKKSVAFNLTLRSDDRSLTAQEADEDVKSILETLKAELNAVLR